MDKTIIKLTAFEASSGVEKATNPEPWLTPCGLSIILNNSLRKKIPTIIILNIKEKEREKKLKFNENIGKEVKDYPTTKPYLA